MKRRFLEDQYEDQMQSGHVENKKEKDDNRPIGSVTLQKITSPSLRKSLLIHLDFHNADSGTKNILSPMTRSGDFTAVS